MYRNKLGPGDVKTVRMQQEVIRNIIQFLMPKSVVADIDCRSMIPLLSAVVIHCWRDWQLWRL